VTINGDSCVFYLFLWKSSDKRKIGACADPHLYLAWILSWLGVPCPSAFCTVLTRSAALTVIRCCALVSHLAEFEPLCIASWCKLVDVHISIRVLLSPRNIHSHKTGESTSYKNKGPWHLFKNSPSGWALYLLSSESPYLLECLCILTTSQVSLRVLQRLLLMRIYKNRHTFRPRTLFSQSLIDPHGETQLHRGSQVNLSLKGAVRARQRSVPQDELWLSTPTPRRSISLSPTRIDEEHWYCASMGRGTNLTLITRTLCTSCRCWRRIIGTINAYITRCVSSLDIQRTRLTSNGPISLV